MSLLQRRASVQALHVRLEAIQGGVVHLAGPRYRAVLEVNGLPHGSLSDETQQEGVLAGYAGFLNGLTFPIQILVRATLVDLDAYLEGVEERAGRETVPALADLARDHADFVRGLARRRTLLERRFYLVVPAQEAGGNAGWLARRLPWRGRTEEALDAEEAGRQLTFRCDEVAAQLSRCGARARRLGDLELARLYQACWSPELARSQRLRRALTDYTSPTVRATDGPNLRRH